MDSNTLPEITMLKVDSAEEEVDSATEPPAVIILNNSRTSLSHK